MKKTNKALWLKLVAWAALTHVILIASSFLEVLIYSVIINPGKEESFYHEHAAVSAPYVAIILGIVLFFFVARFLTKKQPDKRILIALALPIAYIIIDIIILIPFGVDWSSHFLVFILSFGSKILTAFIGAFTIKNQTAN